jgi:hypothetical protein
MRTLTLSHAVQAIAYEDHTPEGVIADFTTSSNISGPIVSHEFGVYLLHCIPGYVLKRARNGRMVRSVRPEEEDQVLVEMDSRLATIRKLMGKSIAADAHEVRQRWAIERELEAVNGPRIEWGNFYPKSWLRQNCFTAPQNGMLEAKFDEILVLNCRDASFVLELHFNDESHPSRWLRSVHAISPSAGALGQVEVAVA